MLRFASYFQWVYPLAFAGLLLDFCFRFSSATLYFASPPLFSSLLILFFAWPGRGGHLSELGGLQDHGGRPRGSTAANLRLRVPRPGCFCFNRPGNRGLTQRGCVPGDRGFAGLLSTDRPTDPATDRPTDQPTDKLTDRSTDWLTD